MTCEHAEFYTWVRVARLRPSADTTPRRFVLQARVCCKECGAPFQFFGLPSGTNFDGASVSDDALEAVLSIGPKGEALPTEHGIRREYVLPALPTRFPH